MKTRLLIPENLLSRIHSDLDRPHDFALERVGFLFCGIADLGVSELGLYAARYLPVEDGHYVNDRTMGAVIGAAAFRSALQICYRNPCSIFHVHRHDHFGKPSPSLVDKQESRRFVPDFWKVAPRHPHGALVLSLDSGSGEIWFPGSIGILPLSQITFVGTPRYAHKVNT